MVEGSFSCGGKTQHVYGWILFWFTSAVTVAVGKDVDMFALSSLLVQCGDNVQMPCEILTTPLDIKYFAWVATNIMCKYEDPRSGSGYLCESQQTPKPNLTLTLLNVMPVNEGSYICKLRSNLAAKSVTTTVKIQACIGNSGTSINEDQARCWFSGVYPRGEIHWYQGEVNLTEFAKMEEDKIDHDGRYNISGTLDIQHGNKNQSYKCSLWIPSSEKSPSSLEVSLIKSLNSSGSMVELLWIFLGVEAMIVKSMT